MSDVYPIKAEHIIELAEGENATIEYDGEEIILVPPHKSKI
jgi:hypothetical protein